MNFCNQKIYVIDKGNVVLVKIKQLKRYDVDVKQTTVTEMIKNFLIALESFWLNGISSHWRFFAHLA